VAYVRVVGVGHLLFALGFIVVGALGLSAHDFVLSQQPVPKGIPWREPLALASGSLLLLTGAGLLVPPAARVSALVLTAFLLLWVLALQLPRVVVHPGIEARWLGVGEDTTLFTGGWVIYGAITERDDASLRIARRIFGLALIPIGLSHFFYLQSAADLIPTWFPLRTPLTMISGAGHIAAGIALFFGIVPRLAATMEAAMESIFTIVCWLTAAVGTPSEREYWVNLFISTALSAAAWAVAKSYRHTAWGLARPAASTT
jgi:uncharacterized membrane protein